MTREQLKKLQKKWYKKLERAGFVDIEHQPSGNLKEFHSIHFKSKRASIQYLEQQRYYQLAEQLYHTFPFADRITKRIWKLHSTGHTIVRISEEVGVSEESVSKAIKYIAGHIVGV